MLTEAANFKKDWQQRQRKAIEAGVDCAYLYVHLEADSGEPFYIGMGETRTRPWDGGRSDKHINRANKHGMIVHVDAAPILSDPVAKWWEVRWIKAFRDAGYNLVNLTDGGEGVSGDILRGDNNHMRQPEYRELAGENFRAHYQTEKGLKDREAIRARMVENNPHHIPEVADKLSGDNHWTRQSDVITPFHGDNNPAKKRENIDRMIHNNPMQNPDIAEAVAKKNRGRKASKETTEKMSAIRKGTDYSLLMGWYSKNVMYQKYWGA